MMPSRYSGGLRDCDIEAETSIPANSTDSGGSSSSCESTGSSTVASSNVSGSGDVSTARFACFRRPCRALATSKAGAGAGTKARLAKASASPAAVSAPTVGPDSKVARRWAERWLERTESGLPKLRESHIDGKAQQAFGHAGALEYRTSFLKAQSDKASRYENELHFYRTLQAAREAGEPMAPYVPEFEGITSVEKADGSRTRYLKLRNLHHGFEEASTRTMDVKMGVRCYEEDELGNAKPRKDLYARLAQMEQRLSAPVLTEDEHAMKGITKARWMTLRDSLSSTLSLGFRIDAVRTPATHTTAFDSDLFCRREDGPIVQMLREFLPPADECEGDGVTPARMAWDIVERLRGLRAALAASALFRQHEFIGSSLYFIADATGHTDVAMIDFGVTSAAPGGGLRHDIPWQLGNHEDGYLIGLDNLLRLWSVLAAPAMEAAPALSSARSTEGKRPGWWWPALSRSTTKRGGASTGSSSGTGAVSTATFTSLVRKSDLAGLAA